MTDRKLYVLRHAKSSWDDPGQHDRERPLAPRGRRAVKLIATHMRESGISPEQVLCSPARRTLETLEGVAPGGEALIEPELYEASATEIIERLWRVPDHVGSVMVVGHNPAMQTLVLRLVDANGPRTSSADLADVRRKFPTGALATLSFECEWRELARGRAQLVSYARPKALH
ncbi:MAG: histidine phosphatase family protein [Solirubrobacteraceae bacterium]|jgi:phosphohistidine phosphatase